MEPTDPDQLIAGYEQQLADAQRKADSIRENLDGVQVTERSASGVTLTVNATGNPEHIEVTDALAQRGGSAVSTEIMRALAAAQAKVAARVEQAMQPHLGGTEAMQRTVNALRSAHPGAPEQASSPEGSGGFRPAPPEESGGTKPPRHRSNDDDDEDTGFGGPIMR